MPPQHQGQPKQRLLVKVVLAALRTRYELARGMARFKNLKANRRSELKNMLTGMLQDRLRAVLDRRAVEGTLRELRTAEADGCYVDFGSNDYLGLARSASLAAATDAEVQRVRAVDAAARRNLPAEFGMIAPVMGSSGSRLLSGNSTYAESLEAQLAQFHKREAALLCNSGYDANLSVFSCLPQKGDALVYDELVHNSVRVGMQLGRQSVNVACRHNDTEHLNEILSELRRDSATGCIFVAVESVYSMDGDVAPLQTILSLAHTYNASVIVDEAHATGLYGDRGQGVVSALQLENAPALCCSVHTFGKALGVHGAVVLCSTIMRQYLINYARPLIYSTSLPLHSLAAINCAYEAQCSMHAERKLVLELVQLFRNGLVSASDDHTTAPLQQCDLVYSTSPIQAVLVPGNDRVIAVANQLRSHGFDVRPIRKPTVNEGTERLRICIHAHNTVSQIQDLVHHIRAFMSGAHNCSMCTCNSSQRTAAAATAVAVTASSSTPCKCHNRIDYFKPHSSTSASSSSSNSSSSSDNSRHTAVVMHATSSHHHTCINARL
jgi:8-amino-7-oxononanoate synthase